MTPCAPEATGPASLELALVQIGQLTVGIPIEQLQHALPRPADLTPLPRRDHALMGLLALGAQCLPVVDLSRWVDIPSATQPDPASERIVVLGDGGRQLGLLVQAVLGVRRVNRSALRTVQHQARPDEVFETVAQIEGLTGWVSLLETQRLMALAQVWSEEPECQQPGNAPSLARTTAAELGPTPPPPADSATRYAVLRLGERLLGFPAVALGELLPRPPLQALGGSDHSGIASWRGRHLPVVDLDRRWPPAASAPVAPPAWLLVLCHGELALGLLMHELCDLVTWSPGQIDAPPHALADLGWVQGLAQDAQGEPVYLIDVEALLAQHPEALISRVDGATPAEGPQRARRGSPPAQRNEQPYLVFEAGALLCTPVAAVQEILALAPEDIPPAGEIAAPLAWRGQWLDLIDLPSRLRPKGRPVRPPSHVLVVQQSQGLQGFLIDGIHAIVPTGRAPLSQVSLGHGLVCDVLTLGDADQQRSVRRIDLSVELA